MCYFNNCCFPSCQNVSPKGRCGSQNSRSVGPRGPQGPMGPQGPAGADGEDGSTPYIGQNGNWWIDGADTGHASQGETPYIGTNGNWWIGDSDTKYEARGPQGEKGEKGDVGTGLHVDGVVSTEADLPEQSDEGFIYFVEEASEFYVYDSDNATWFNLGTLKGVKGDKGDPGEPGAQGEKGEDGEDGETPYIGANGNWWIGTTDTNFPSRGERGEQGIQGVQGVQGIQGVQGVQGEKGDTGPEGPEGPSGSNSTKVAYFVTLNLPSLDVPDEGLQVASDARLPLDRLERNLESICTLNDDNTIQCSDAGTYEITFVVNGYAELTGETFNPLTDFVSIGFRSIDKKIVYAGANDFFDIEVPHNIVGNGLFVVTSADEKFELVNLQKKTLYITGGRIDQTVSDSYFGCPIVTVTVKKLHD